MAPRRERRRHEAGGPTEEAILRATAEILETTPMADLAVREILERAGVSRATFYFYFGSKYAPVAALFRRILEDVLEAFYRHWAASDDAHPQRGLRNALAASYGLFEDNAALLRAVADARGDEEIGEAFHAMIDRLVVTAQAKVDRERAAGRAPAGADSHAIAAAMIWMNERSFYLHSLGEASPWPTTDALIDALAAVWTGAVYGDR
jgi:TetR/AcrR family transcriptional regulator, ethionamide resistance regulator